MFLGERSVFSYCICKRELLECEAVKVRVGEYHVYTNRNTHFEYREDPDVSLFVIGIAACLNGGESALMPLYKEAKTLKDTFPNVSVGVHWTLSGAGKPVTPKDQVPSLVNEKGDLFSYAEFRKRYRNGLIKDEEILKELRGQYERYYDLMGMPDYWNTHQNTHVDFKIYQLFVALAAELKIPAMRSHQRIYVPASNPNDKLPLVWRIIEPFKSRLIDHWQHQAHRKGMSSPEGLIVTICPKDMNNIDYVFKNIKWGKHQVGEFVIHPATCNDSPFFGKIVDQRIVEYKLFSAENTLKEIKSCGIELVNYSVL